MPQVSKNKLSKKIEDELCGTLDLVISKLGKKESTSHFLTSFLTPTERIMFAKRLAVIVLLKDDVPDSDIAQALNVTRVTVARMRLFMEARGAGLDVVFEIMKNDKNMSEFKSVLLKLAAYTIRASGGHVKPTIF